MVVNGTKSRIQQVGERIDERDRCRQQSRPQALLAKLLNTGWQTLF